ncbi:MAG: alpha/beta hydrolase family protein [Planctomycetota bacterium]
MRPCLLAFLLASCVTAPAIPEAGRATIDLSLFPAGTERVEIGGEQKLRGIFVPGDPVVLMFCESRGSITNGAAAYPVAWDLKALGMGLLCVDYRGVGASDGEGSPDHLAADARTAWREAKRRSDRVVLRGLSLGGLAISLLLDDGAEPDAVVIGAPVRAETAVSRFADEWGEGWERTAAKWLVRRPAATDVVGALAKTVAPALVFCGGDDPYLSHEERRMFRDAADSYVEKPEEDHHGILTDVRGLVSEERALYLRLFPELPRVGERVARIRREVPGAPPEEVLAASLAHHCFDVPSTAAAVALSWPPGSLRSGSELAGWMRTLPPLPLDAAVALVEMDHRYEADFLGWLVWVAHQPEPDEPEALLAAIRRTRRHAKVKAMVASHAFGSVSFDEWVLADRDKERPAPDRPHLDRLRLPEHEMLRQGFLLALKAAHIPARPVEGGVQVWDNHWRFIPLP